MPDVQNICGRLERGEIDTARCVDLLVRHVATRIGCSRAALRLVSNDGQVLRTVALYDRAADRLLGAPDIREIDRSGLRARLQRDGCVVVGDTGADPFVAGSLADYLRRGDIRSLLEVGCSINGSVVGTLACEQSVAPVTWSRRQIQWLRTSASRISLALAHVARVGVDTTPGALWDTGLSHRLATMPLPLDLPED